MNRYMTNDTSITFTPALRVVAVVAMVFFTLAGVVKVISWSQANHRVVERAEAGAL
jgi:hypothetical protein